MNKIFLIAIFLSIPMVSNASTYVPCGADEEGTCWSCGKTCSARLTYPSQADKDAQKNATLTYSGYGAMYNYESPYDNNPELKGVEPWYSVSNQITKAVVEEGITSVGNRSIYAMHNLKEVSLPETVTSIGMRGFFHSKGLENLDIPDTVTSIGDFAFQHTSIKKIVIPESINNLSKAFLCESEKEGCVALPLEEIYCASSNAQQCAAAVKHLGITPKIYEKTSNGQVFYNNKWYDSANDILSGHHTKKRIYSVDEANKVTGKKNSVGIRYK